ncbi:GNAT family N-acetyltransferase [Alcanivorax sp. JB21]|uniref:GNAT family N-acetyltransferase n=1 Tax=Alcanivorax limicola TaxID=2874102 RepID=UPI001CBB3E23|nr:GNAT family N-acetyltransferase [Alcanivorax limicola]MBZ2188821.1 GNAT family N-acetyltransferase [Alcanivorax limicola]
MAIEFKVNFPIATDQFIELLESSTLGERRPIHDRVCMQGMLANSNLVVSAWDGALLIGIARSVTDFHYACYLSDLAVRASYQNAGIGKRLQSLTQEQLGPRCKLILIAAPAADAYYAGIGYAKNDRCWVLERDISIHTYPA